MADPLAEEAFCYVTTTGRRSRRPHTIEMWFGTRGDTLYLLSGGGDRSDWVRNIQADASVTVRVGAATRQARGRIVTALDEDALARRLLASKYQGWREGRRFSRWAATALPVALDLGT